MSDWENNVRKVTPYIPGEQPEMKQGIIKLNTNENPYPPSKAVAKALKEADAADLRLYPDPEARELVKALAEVYGVKKEQVFVGVGSDDVLANAFLTFFNSDKPVLFPEITYSFYDVWADVYKIPYKTIPLKEDYSLDADGFMQENGGIIFPNPNAPTGVLETVATVEKIVAANPGSVVIVDEAYIDFGGESCLPLVKKYDNLLVVQTFSKSRQTAGLRIGFAIGNEKLIKCLSDVRFSINSYTMNRLTISLGAAAARDTEYLKETTAKIIRTREHAKKALTRLGFEFPDSMSNFIFAKHKTMPAKEIFEQLKKRGIYVRHWDKPGLEDHLRISIGRDSEMRTFYEILGEILK